MVSDSEDEGEPQNKAKRTIGSDDEDVVDREAPKEDVAEGQQPPTQEEYDSDEGVRNE